MIRSAFRFLATSIGRLLDIMPSESRVLFISTVEKTAGIAILALKACDSCPLDKTTFSPFDISVATALNLIGRSSKSIFCAYFTNKFLRTSYTITLFNTN